MSRTRTLLAAALLLAPAAAAADPAASDAAAPNAPAQTPDRSGIGTEAPASPSQGARPTVAPARSSYSFGARVGGYGFRRDAGEGKNQWDECRMNGIGLFGERRLGRYLFVETGLDLYFSQNFPTQPVEGDLPIDRVSGIVTAAAGMRAHATSRLSGYAQLGVGVELTRVSVPYEDHEISDQLAMPTGFLGIGGDIRLGAKTYVGANFRFHVMGNFDYDPAKLEMESGWTTPPSADEVFDPSTSLAAQGQFYLRRDL